MVNQVIMEFRFIQLHEASKCLLHLESCRGRALMIFLLNEKLLARLFHLFEKLVSLFAGITSVRGMRWLLLNLVETFCRRL